LSFGRRAFRSTAGPTFFPALRFFCIFFRYYDLHISPTVDDFLSLLRPLTRANSYWSFCIHQHMLSCTSSLIPHLSNQMFRGTQSWYELVAPVCIWPPHKDRVNPQSPRPVFYTCRRLHSFSCRYSRSCC
jgi:hypothetical protein